MAASKSTPSITVHPAAALFPMMSDDDLAELATSIKAHGLREPIQCLTKVENKVTNWIVLDGRNRLEALRRYLKVKDVDIIQTYLKPVQLGKLYATPAEYVLMANIERRNLTQPQRRDLAGKLALMIAEAQADKPKAEKVDALAEAAKKAGVSRRTAATAKQKLAGKAPAVKKDSTPAAGRPVAIITSLKNTLNVVKNLSTTKKWDLEQVIECHKLASDIRQCLWLLVGDPAVNPAADKPTE